jgi:hypothetical protein
MVSWTSIFSLYYNVTCVLDSGDNNDDLFLASSSHATSPIDSGNESNEGNTDVVYEIDSDDSDIAPERLAESAQAELSTHTASH